MSPAEAEEFNPTNAEELIAAMNDANGNDEADVINLAEGATCTLDERDNNQLGINGLPVISTEVEINGNGATIERGDRAVGNFQILAIGQTGPLEPNPPRAEVTLRNLTISGGRGSSLGGAILNGDSVLTITGCTITGNTADQFGGGVYSETSAPQGSIPPQSRTTIVNSTVTNNRTSFAGGGVHNDEGYTEISYSTITDNTITSVQSSGGGVSNGFQTATNFTSNIIVGNRASTQQDDVGGSPGSFDPFESGGYNLVGAGSRTGDFTGPGDRTGVSVAEAFGNGSPRLEDNGGPTPTIGLTPGSVAIDRVPADTAGTPPTDQRGVERPQFAGADSGSFEYDDEVPEIVISQRVLPSATVGERYLRRLSASSSGSEYTFAVRDESPPSSLTLSEDGRLSGIPQRAGTFIFIVEARDASGFTGEREFTLRVKAAPESPRNPNACTIKGTPGNDRLVGTSGRDVICGLSGRDVVYGLGGNDVPRGGPGNDILFGGPGRDKLIGGGGNDRLVGGSGKDWLIGGPGRNSLKQ